MSVEQKRFRRKKVCCQLLWISFFGGIYFFSPEWMLERRMDDITSLLAYKIAMDFSAIYILVNFINLMMLLIVKTEDFYCRTKLYVLSIVSIFLFACFVFIQQNMCSLRIDIILFAILFINLFVKSGGYLNGLQVLELSIIANYMYNECKKIYTEIICGIQDFNKKEEELLQSRIKYAESESEVRKAKKDQRTYSIDDKFNPDYYQYPREPDKKKFMGFNGLFNGRNVVICYESEVGRYIDSLDKIMSKMKKREKELKIREEDLDDVMRFINGTQAEAQIEKIIGRSVDRAERVRSSYKKFNRRKFERKHRKI